MNKDLRTNKEISVPNNDSVRKCIIAVILLLIQFQSGELLHAQAVQKGVVQEYNEKARKTPLGGVELNVRSAGSTVSDKNGDFKLSFLTLKPGEKINVRRIEKLGYEIFNKEAIEQWNLNPKNPFVIIMCRSDKFKKIRDNYERVSSKSYARQLKKEEAALAKLKNEGKLKDTEYQKQLFNLRENYEKQIDNLENYVDRFSRIDLSELNATEQEIIELVQQGRIDEAIAKYDAEKYVDKYSDAISELNEVSNAINKLAEVKESKLVAKEDLLQRIYRYVSTLRLAGGIDNFNKIGTILHEVVLADTTNSSTLWEYIDFLHEQNNYNELEGFLNSYLAMDLSLESRIEALRRKILVCINLGKYEEGEQVISELNNQLLKNPHDKQGNSFSAFEIANIEFTIGSLYMSCQHPEKAISVFERCISILPDFSMDFENENKDIWLKIHAGYCYCCLKVGDKYKFSSQIEELLFTAMTLIKSESKLDYATLKSIVDIAQLLELNKQFDESKILYEYVEDIYKRDLESNPRYILPLYANLVSAEGILFHKIGDFDMAEKKYLEAIELYERAYTNIPKQKNVHVRKILNNVGSMYLKNKEFDKALEVSEKSFNIARQNYIEAPFFYKDDYMISCKTLARIYDETNKMEMAEKLYIEADELWKVKFAEVGDSCIERFWIESLDLPLFYVKSEQYTKLIPILEKLLETGQQFITPEHKLYEPYINSFYFLGRAYRMTEKYEKAKIALEYHVTCKPRGFIGYLELARVEATMGNIELAKKYLDKALANKPDALRGIADDDILLSLIRD